MRCGHDNQCCHSRDSWICQQTWKFKKKPNVFHVYNKTCLVLSDMTKCFPTNQGWEKLLGGIKRWEFTFLNFFCRIHFTFIWRTQQGYRPGLIWLAKPSTKIKLQANFHYLCAIPVIEKRYILTRTCKHVKQKKTGNHQDISVWNA